MGGKDVKSPDAKKEAKGTAFINRFSEMLRQINCNCQLENCAFANVNNAGGFNNESKTYKDLKEDGHVPEIAIGLIKGCNAKIVFTCSDIFELILKDCGCSATTDGGLKYKNGKLMRKTVICGVEIYEIIHPSRCSGLKVALKP